MWITLNDTLQLHNEIVFAPNIVYSLCGLSFRGDNQN